MCDSLSVDLSSESWPLPHAYSRNGFLNVETTPSLASGSHSAFSKSKSKSSQLLWTCTFCVCVRARVANGQLSNARIDIWPQNLRPSLFLCIVFLLPSVPLVTFLVLTGVCWLFLSAVHGTPHSLHTRLLILCRAVAQLDAVARSWWHHFGTCPDTWLW